MTWSDPLVITIGLGLAAIAAVLAIAFWPNSPGVVNVFKGANADPRLTALLRALCLYVIPMLAAAAIGLIGGLSHPLLVPLVPILIGLIRWFEGFVLTRLPEPPRADPPAPGGIPNGLDAVRRPPMGIEEM